MRLQTVVTLVLLVGAWSLVGWAAWGLVLDYRAPAHDPQRGRSRCNDERGR